MSIRLLQAIFLSGVYTAVDGATLFLAPGLEADLVAQGKAAWVSPPRTTLDTREHSLYHAAMGFKEANSRNPLVVFGAPFTGITITPQAGCTINSAGPYDLNGEQVYRIVASSVGTFKYFEVEMPEVASGFSCTNATFECAFEDPATLMSTIYLYVGDSTYTKNMKGTAGTLAGANKTRAPCRAGMTAYQFDEVNWTLTGVSAPIGNEIFTKAKFRINPADGATTTVYLKRIAIGGRRQSRIAITADDGYLSWPNIGQPVLDEYGLVSSMAIITAATGDSGYASWADLRRFVSNGLNECVPHGPNHPTTKGTGNLWTAWTTDAERLADVLGCRDRLVAEGVTSARGAKCYVWPQGQYTGVDGDTAFLQMLVDNGFWLGRGVTGDAYRNFRASLISEKNPGRLVLNIAGGHSWASAGTEAANIASIISYVQAAATSGMDCCLVFHRVVGVDAASNSTMISVNRLREICVAIKALVDAGSMRSVRFSDLAY